MTNLRLLRQDKGSLFALLPKDIVVFCITPYIRYHPSIGNLFGIAVAAELDRTSWMEGLGQRELRARGVSKTYIEVITVIRRSVNYFRDRNRMSLYQIENLRTAEQLHKLDIEQLRCLYICVLLRRHDDFSIASSNNELRKTLIGCLPNRKLSFESFYRSPTLTYLLLHTFYRCTKCHSVTHVAEACPIEST